MSPADRALEALPDDRADAARANAAQLRRMGIPGPTLRDLLDCVKRHGRTRGDDHCILQTGRETLNVRDFETLERAYRAASVADRPRVRRA